MSCLGGAMILLLVRLLRGTDLVSFLLTEMQRVEMDLEFGLIVLGRDIRW